MNRILSCLVVFLLVVSMIKANNKYENTTATQKTFIELSSVEQTNTGRILNNCTAIIGVIDYSFAKKATAAIDGLYVFCVRNAVNNEILILNKAIYKAPEKMSTFSDQIVNNSTLAKSLVVSKMSLLNFKVILSDFEIVTNMILMDWLTEATVHNKNRSYYHNKILQAMDMAEVSECSRAELAGTISENKPITASIAYNANNNFTAAQLYTENKKTDNAGNSPDGIERTNMSSSYAA